MTIIIDYDHHQVELGPGGLLGGKERKGRSTKTVVECKREGLVSLIFFQLFFLQICRPAKSDISHIWSA